MAARFAADHPQDIHGLLLLAAWPEDSVDLASAPLAVTSVYGSEDGLATPGEVLAAAPRLPADTAFIRIEGGNHAQFGRYGRQNGDNEALIPSDTQQMQIVAATLALLRRVDDGGLTGLTGSGSGRAWCAGAGRVRRSAPARPARRCGPRP